MIISAILLVLFVVVILLEFRLKSPILRSFVVVVAILATSMATSRFVKHVHAGMRDARVPRIVHKIMTHLCNLADNGEYELLRVRLHAVREQLPVAMQDGTGLGSVVNGLQHISTENTETQDIEQSVTPATSKPAAFQAPVSEAGER